MEKNGLKERILNANAIELARKDFPLVDKNQTLSHAFKLMEKYRIDRIIVTEDKMPIGIMTKKDVLSKLMMERTRLVTASRLHISSFTSTPLIHIEPNTSISEAISIMLSKKVSSLPITKDEKVVGLLLKLNIAALFIDNDSIKSQELSIPPIKIAKYGERVTHLRELFLFSNAIFIPVVDTFGKLVGNITVNEIADALFFYHENIRESSRKKAKKEIFVEDVMSRPPIWVDRGAYIKEAASKMLALNSKGITVLDGEKIFGIITENEFLSKALAYV